MATVSFSRYAESGTDHQGHFSVCTVLPSIPVRKVQAYASTMAGQDKGVSVLESRVNRYRYQFAAAYI